MSTAAAVRAGDDLEEMPAGILPIHPAASVIGVELARPAFEGVGPVRQAAFSDPIEDLVELRLADQKGIVLRMGCTVVVGEVERTSFATSTTRNGPEGVGSGRPRISARKVADSRLSRTRTIVWFNCTLTQSTLPATCSSAERCTGGSP